MTNNLHNPYSGNILISMLPPIPSEDDILRHLTVTPIIPSNILDMPTKDRLHYLLDIKDSLHIPSLEGCRLAETIDLMIRRGYNTRSPEDAHTWSQVMGLPPSNNHTKNSSGISASANGISGVGKSATIGQSLCYYHQVIVHNAFPKTLGKHYQMVWLSVEVPASGKTEHFASAIMQKWDEALSKVTPNISLRFTDTLNATNRDGVKMFEEWHQVAKSHFLGILHLDEVQNFFKIPALRQRQAKNAGKPFELSLIEDKLLKTILNLINSGIPILVSGTPDGISAMSNRFSTSQRLSSYGFHELLRFERPDDVEFLVFLGELMKYQYVKTPLLLSNELASLLINLTAGIKRLIINLWVFAIRNAYHRGQDNLLIQDFIEAERQDFKEIRPAIRAILSKDPFLMSQYEDLLARFK